MTDVRRHRDAESLVADVASALLTRLEEVQAAGDMPHVGLTGGSIADDVHRELARRGPDSSVDWKRVVFWWGDERFVAADSEERNARQARVAFLDQVGAAPEHVHEVPSSGEVRDAEAAASAYADTLREHGSGAFDVLMLGLGPDGHTASLFPGHPALQAGGIAVAVHDSPKPPPDRVSLTFEALGRSREVWFVVAGEDKADAVARALAREGSVRETPARGVTSLERTVWWLDDPAASLTGQ